MDPNDINADKRIPLTLLRHAEGIAFISIIKGGLFFIGGAAGGGCVVAKVYNDEHDPKKGYRWSAPSSVGVGSLFGGIVFGASKVDSVIILNTKSAVRAFMSDQITFGGALNISVGPYGREADANIGVGQNKEISAAFSYSKSQGAMFSASLDGAVLLSRNDDNKKSYKSQEATASRLLSGDFPMPEKYQILANELEAIIHRQGRYKSLETTESMSSNNQSLNHSLQLGKFAPFLCSIPAKLTKQTMIQQPTAVNCCSIAGYRSAMSN